MNLRKAVATTAAAGALTSGAMLAAAAPASAGDGTCNWGHGSGDLCYFYTNTYSSMADFPSSDPDLSDDYFRTWGAGRGQTVDNNSWTVCNNDTRDGWLLFDGYHYTGDWMDVPVWVHCTDLGSMRDRVSSHYWYT